MKTIKDVAERAGVSISTVSRVFSGNEVVKEETKQRVLKVATDMGYAPNHIGRYLKSGQTNTIGVLIPDIRNPIFSLIVRGIEDMAQRLKYSIFLCNTDEDAKQQKHYLQLMRSMRVAGLITASGPIDIKEHPNLDWMPMVSIIRQVAGMDALVADNYGGIIAALELLLSQGRTRIAIARGPSRVDPYLQRYAAYKNRLTEAGLFDEKLVFDVNPLTSNCEFSDCDHDDIAYQQIKEFCIANEDIDAILAANDVVAMKCIRVLWELGREIPEDVAIVGFDNIDFSTTTVPPLTTISQPLYQMGRDAVTRLIERIQAEEVIPETVVTYETKLIERATT